MNSRSGTYLHKDIHNKNIGENPFYRTLLKMADFDITKGVEENGKI